VAAMEQCSVRDAALKLQAWFRIGESEVVSGNQNQESPEQIEVSPGIYNDPDGALFEVIANAVSAEDFEMLVVYRELFGDYSFWVAPAQREVQRPATRGGSPSRRPSPPHNNF